MVKEATSVRLSDEQKTALEAIGRRDDRSRSWLISRAIDEYIERHKVERSEAAPAATRSATSSAQQHEQQPS